MSRCAASCHQLAALAPLRLPASPSELLLAYLAWEQDALDRAEAYLAEAAAIIAINKSRADRALFHRVTGLVAISRAGGKPCPEGLDQLDEAIRLFDRIGNKASADYVRGERARLAGVMEAAAGASVSGDA